MDSNAEYGRGICIDVKIKFKVCSIYAIISCLVTIFIGLLMANTQDSRTYRYDPAFAILLTEIIKLLACILWYFRRNNLLALSRQTRKNIKLLWLYFIPALLYCCYNNLSYVNLLHFDPSTYSILLQLRIVITGLLFQILFKKTLTALQWLSLVFLMIGCTIKNMNLAPLSQVVNDFLGIKSANAYNTTNVRDLTHNLLGDEFGLNVDFALIVLQVLCSCFAGVYTEFLLKNTGAHVEMVVQNVFLYADSIICNALILLWKSYVSVAFDEPFQAGMMNIKVLIMILNNAAFGLVTGVFLKYFDSILKTMANALELIFVALLTFLFWGIAITWQASLSIVVVTFSVILYGVSPVKNTSVVNSKTIPKENITPPNTSLEFD